jgi:hypothetical protein
LAVDALAAGRFAVVLFPVAFAVEVFLAVDLLAVDVFAVDVFAVDVFAVDGFDEPRRPAEATLFASFGALSAMARPICGARLAT